MGVDGDWLRLETQTTFQFADSLHQGFNSLAGGAAGLPLPGRTIPVAVRVPASVFFVIFTGWFSIAFEGS